MRKKSCKVELKIFSELQHSLSESSSAILKLYSMSPIPLSPMKNSSKVIE